MAKRKKRVTRKTSRRKVSRKAPKQSMGSILLISIIASIVAAAITTVVIDQIPRSQDQLIADHYDTETATLVSPHGLRKHIADEEYIIVDLRSREEYLEEHIVTALNVPAYKDRDHSDYGAVDRIRAGFKAIQADNPDTPIVVYCYSIPCMTGRKVGKILADDGIYVHELGIGWNEWRYHWDLWNHPHEWDITNVEDYIVSGPEPGEFTGDQTGTGCPIGGGLGC